MSFSVLARRSGPAPPDAAPRARATTADAPGALAQRLAMRVAPPSAAAPLEVAAPGDPQEREAESAAARVTGTPDARPRRSSAVDTLPPGAGAGVAEYLRSSAGAPLEPEARAFMEPRFGRAFSDVRVHTGPGAAASARSVGAAAYAVGRDMVFGGGVYQPHTHRGRRVLAHELAHVAQQTASGRLRVQRTTVDDYVDVDPTHDPSRVSDAALQATAEYQRFSTVVVPPGTAPYATPAEALLAVRLLLRWLREGRSRVPYTDRGLAVEFINRAKRQLGALAGAAAQVGQLNWVPFNSGQAVRNPGAMQSDFARWVLAGGPQPSTMSGSINCWEMVLFGAYRSGYITFLRIQQIYNLGVSRAATQGLSVGATVESELRRGAENVFTPGNPLSPQPLAGDIVIFNRAQIHVAIATGTLTSTGDHEVISLWNQPGNVSTVQRTTIEALLAAAGPGAQPVKFWGAAW